MSAISSNARLLAPPGMGFADIDATLEALGWLLLDESQTAPILAGEPEMAQWQWRGYDALITYTFNPVVGLRVLAFSGADALQAWQHVSARIAGLQRADLEFLLASADTQNLLLGLYAAAELHDVGLLAAVSRLVRHPQPEVAAAAGRTQALLGRDAVSLGIDSLQQRQATRPDRSPLFADIGDVELRRQTVRWWIHDRPALTPELLKALATALEDPDWEVRASAMLAAARLGARQLGLAIRRLALPTSGKHGLSRDDRSVLQAMRRACLEQVSRAPLPHPVDAKARQWLHLRRCVAAPVRGLDPVAMWVYRLSTPLDKEGELEPRLPETLPSAVVADGDGLKLALSGLCLKAIGAGEYLLGCEQSPLANPWRWQTQQTSFLLCERPLSVAHAAAIRELCGSGSNVLPGPGRFTDINDNQPWIGSRAEAEALVNDLAGLEGAALRLPLAHEWEMGERGSDGRLHPWGNGLPETGSPSSQISPAGLLALPSLENPVGASGAGEWSAQCLCGGDRRGRCGWRSEGPLGTLRMALSW